MITSPFAYVAILLFVAGCLRFLEQRYKQSLFFTYLPAAVLLYLVIMLLSTFNVWERNADITATYSGLKQALLPAMIFLMLLKSDLRKIRRLGGKEGTQRSGNYRNLAVLDRVGYMATIARRKAAVCDRDELRFGLRSKP